MGFENHEVRCKFKEYEDRYPEGCLGCTMIKWYFKNMWDQCCDIYCIRRCQYVENKLFSKCPCISCLIKITCIVSCEALDKIGEK